MIGWAKLVSPSRVLLLARFRLKVFFCSSIRLFVYNHPSLILCTQIFADNNPQFTEDNGHFVNVRAFLVAYKFTMNDLNIDCVQECDSGRMCCWCLRRWYYLPRRAVSKCRLSVHWGQRRWDCIRKMTHCLIELTCTCLT